MKKMRKIASLLLALVMVLSMAMTAFAAETYTITIENDAAGYKYEAYQIFDGDLSTNGKLSNIIWGNGVDSSKEDLLMNALKNVDNNGDKPFAGCTDAASVAEKLAEFADDNEVVQKFADVVGQYLSTTSKKESSTVEGGYTITLTEPGYYLVKNSDVPGVDEDEDTPAGSYTRYILKVVKDVEVKHKGEVPSVNKVIVETGEEVKEVKENQASIGDTITYKFTGTLPTNIVDYDTYFYKFTDTLSKGLTYNGNLVVTVNGQPVTDYFYAKATENKDPAGNVTSTTLIVAIEDLLALEEISDFKEINNETTVVVTYDAILNENAEVGPEKGNENNVDLEYSNDPNNDGEGATTPPETPDELPTTELPTGVTPKDEVYTYTTEIIINKVDENDKTLPGAAFKIEGESVNLVVTTGDVYVAYGEGDTVEESNCYWRLKDGTYTTQDPAGEITDDEGNQVEVDTSIYEDVDTKYHKETKVTIDGTPENVVVEAFVNENGQITFTGLGEGEYKITETVTPDGYNSIEPITVTITWDKEGNNCTWTYEWSNNSKESNGNSVTIENKSGSTLPSTGGIGTTIFYVIGGVLVLAAVVLLITKRRMSIEE